MSSHPFMALELGKVFGSGWASVAPWSDVEAVSKGERQARSLEHYIGGWEVLLMRFDDRGQAEEDFWEGFVAGVKEHKTTKPDADARLKEFREWEREQSES